MLKSKNGLNEKESTEEVLSSDSEVLIKEKSNSKSTSVENILDKTQNESEFKKMEASESDVPKASSSKNTKNDRVDADIGLNGKSQSNDLLADSLKDQEQLDKIIMHSLISLLMKVTIFRLNILGIFLQGPNL